MSEKKKEKAGVKRILQNDMYALKLLFRSSKYYVISSLIMAVISTLLPIFEHTFLLAHIVNCIQYGRPFGDVLWFLIPVTLTVVLKLIFSSYHDTTALPKAQEKVNRDIRLMLYEKARSMDIACYDNPEFYNDFVWSMTEATGHVYQVLTSVYKLTGALTGIICMGTYISFADPVGLIFVVSTLGISLFLQFRFNKLNMKMWQENNPIQRRRDYVSRVFYLADYSKDLRMGNMKEQLYGEFESSSEGMMKNRENFGKKLWLLTSLDRNLRGNLAFDGLYLSYLMFMALVKKAFPYGTLLALYNASRRLTNNISWLTYVVPSFQEHSLYIEKMRRFLETENKIEDRGTASLPQGGEIRFENVSFRYPGAEKESLSGINMQIHKGEKIALVGYNGAGKSTLVKLMMRLYDPTEGSVFYDGKPLDEYPLDGYRSKIGTLFQDYQIIASSLAENVTMSTETIDRDGVLKALDSASFGDVLNGLSAGLETPMTKEFDDNGTNLSGGEAQKVAIARVLYGDKNILILDEPSSALDPLAEYRLNQTVKELAGDKTVIFISHRLSTTRAADCIYMLENGRIIEHGSHDELMEQNGKYAEMFSLQAEKYR